MSACDPLNYRLKEDAKLAISIEAGGIVPLPRAGGALSHAIASIRNLPRHCQNFLPSSFRRPFPH
jgi:hypothetical protein